MELIIARPSPYARKVRIALIEKSIPCVVTVDNPWLENPRIQQVNPIGKVPALLTDHGDVIHDSKVIFEYIEMIYPTPALLPDAPREKIIHKQVEAICDGICDAIVLIAMEGTRPAETRSAPWVARQARKIYAGVEELSNRLGGRGSFTDMSYGLAEIAVVTALTYVDFRYPEFDWRPKFPNLLDLYDRVSVRESFKETVPEGQTLPVH